MKDKQDSKLLYLSPDVLMTHPKNLRRFYPEAQVREMAESIRQSKGVYQAMLIVPNGHKGKYFVVDGNIRLHGARLLGRECPKLKCEVVDAGKAEQLLTMVVTSQFRYDPDPISEALHYKRLMDEEGYSVQRIAHTTGLYEKRITTRLKLLNLDSEIQELIANRKLPTDERVADAFLSISNAKARVKLAQRLAKDGVSIKAILIACGRLSISLQGMAETKTSIPASAIVKKQASTAEPVKWQQVRKAAADMCRQCDFSEKLLKSTQEPAWSLVVHATEETCGNCNISDVKDACSQCPGVVIILRLISALRED